MLTDAQNDAWEEITLIKNYYPKIIDQIKFAKNHSNIHKDFISKKINTDFRTSILTYYEILKAREFYWHTIIKKYSTKKREITSSSLNLKKIVRKNFFYLPDPDTFVQNIPRKGFIIKSFVEGKSSRSIRLLSKVPISHGNKPFRCKIDLDHYPSSTSKWTVGKTYDTFVTNVNYFERRYFINVPLTNLVKRISKSDYSFKSIPFPIQKNGKLVGYYLRSKGNKFFLPRSQLKKNPNKNKSLSVILTKKDFNPFSLVVKLTE